MKLKCQDLVFPTPTSARPSWRKNVLEKVRFATSTKSIDVSTDLAIISKSLKWGWLSRRFEDFFQMPTRTVRTKIICFFF
jgi:hypothetical protein